MQRAKSGSPCEALYAAQLTVVQQRAKVCHRNSRHIVRQGLQGVQQSRREPIKEALRLLVASPTMAHVLVPALLVFSHKGTLKDVKALPARRTPKEVLVPVRAGPALT